MCLLYHILKQILINRDSREKDNIDFALLIANALKFSKVASRNLEK